MPRVVVALSGGVDSATAAALLVEQGYEVIGIMMRLWVAGEWPLENRCCSSEAVDDARRVAYLLDIPFYLVNYEQPFRTHVVDYFLEEYARGRTPNPCLACNKFIKFGLLLERALSLDAAYLATGHYCRIARSNGRYRLLRGVDRRKDQSYMLYMLGQKELSRLIFPLGDLTKEQVRSLAAQRGLPVAEKAESQDLCFTPTGDYRSFLQANRPNLLAPGPILDLEGNQIGMHKGLAFYTVGQRHGLGLGSSNRRMLTGTNPEPLYVIRLDPERKAVIVGPENALWRRELVASQVSFVSGEGPAGSVTVTAKVRYRSPEAPATIEPLGDGRLLVRFQEPQRAITPGQAIVFYQGDEVLGGGIIDEP